jgi:AraC-like DNA-binding protein
MTAGTVNKGVLEPVDEAHPSAGPPRGLLHEPADASESRHSRRLPSEDLRAFVQSYWIVNWDLNASGPRTVQTIPHPSVHLVLERAKSRVHGILKGRFTRVLEGRGRVFGIKFRPGGFYPFVNSPVSELTNRVISAREVFGLAAEILESAVLAFENEAEMIGAAERFLRGRMPQRDEAAEFAGRVVDSICADREVLTVEDVVTRFNVGKRTLQRLFDRYVGVSPKWVIRVYRLHEIIERLKAGESVDFASLSQDLGYFDQAHFVKDFKSIVGRTPTEYARSLLVSAGFERT